MWQTAGITREEPGHYRWQCHGGLMGGSQETPISGRNNSTCMQISNPVIRSGRMVMIAVASAYISSPWMTGGLQSLTPAPKPTQAGRWKYRFLRHRLALLGVMVISLYFSWRLIRNENDRAGPPAADFVSQVAEFREKCRELPRRIHPKAAA